MKRAFTVITAAGQSRRMGGTDKLLLPLQGRPLIVATVEQFASWPPSDALVVSVTPGREDELQELLNSYLSPHTKIHVVPGGRERQDSIRKALEVLQERYSPTPEDVVLIHDGARPFVDHNLFHRLLEALPNFDGVLPATPVRDTIKRVQGNSVVRTEDRETLRQVQTPQVFFFPTVFEAHQRAHQEGFLGTDDASLIEHFGGSVGWVEGPVHNLKVTVPADIALLEELSRKNVDTALSGPAR